MSRDSMEKQKGLRISALDDDEEEENEQQQEEDDDDDDDKEEKEFVILGFVEKPKTHWSLLRQLFPSKAGGVPAWLDPMNLPSGKSCVCDVCGEPLQFLLQVYAPIEKEYAFHRTLFVFMCLSMNCLLRDQHEQWKRHPEKPSRSVKVFRCQLPRFNPFYRSEPPRHDGTDRPAGTGAALCSWCGTWKGDKFCSSCRTARYCSEKHQVVHWRSGHKVDCQRMIISSDCPNKNGASSANLQKVASNTLWAEYEMIIGNESEFSTEIVESNACTNSLVSKDKNDDPMKSHINFEGDDEKKSWASFQECIAKAPEQVLRYCRDGSAKPLWPMSSGRPSKADIPKCKFCGGPLCFEFQILAAKAMDKIWHARNLLIHKAIQPHPIDLSQLVSSSSRSQVLAWTNSQPIKSICSPPTGFSKAMVRLWQLLRLVIQRNMLWWMLMSVKP